MIQSWQDLSGQSTVVFYSLVTKTHCPAGSMIIKCHFFKGHILYSASVMWQGTLYLMSDWPKVCLYMFCSIKFSTSLKMASVILDLNKGVKKVPFWGSHLKSQWRCNIFGSMEPFLLYVHVLWNFFCCENTEQFLKGVRMQRRMKKKTKKTWKENVELRIFISLMM